MSYDHSLFDALADNAKLAMQSFAMLMACDWAMYGKHITQSYMGCLLIVSSRLYYYKASTGRKVTRVHVIKGMQHSSKIQIGCAHYVSILVLTSMHSVRHMHRC